jgi:transglutaminase 1
MLIYYTDDQVYMSDERLLDEYVLNDVGKIWVGPHGSCRGREWIFGQFDAVVLPAVDLMMSRSNLAPVNRGNPIYVTRAISKMVGLHCDIQLDSFDSSFTYALNRLKYTP